MPQSSVEELKRQVAAGEYVIDSGELAGAILTKFAIVRRVRRGLAGEAEEAEGESGREARPRSRRARPEPSRDRQPRGERLP